MITGAIAGSSGYLLAFFGELPVGASQTTACAVIVLVAAAAKALIPSRRPVLADGAEGG